MLGSVYKSKSAFYSDFTIDVISSNQIRVLFKPEFSQDLSGYSRAAKHIVNGRDVLGRSFTVIVPSDGDAEASYTFARIGTVSSGKAQSVISSEFPLVYKHSSFYVRGHKIVRFVIFPHRFENSIIAAYGNFDIQITISGTVNPNIEAVLSPLDKMAARTTINPEGITRFMFQTTKQSLFKPQVDIIGNTGQWVKISVEAQTVYKITAAALQQAGINTASLRSDSLRMFYGGGMIPPANFSEVQPELEQISILVNDGGDGSFSGNDYLVFYGEAPNRFLYDSDSPEYYKNAYGDVNVYWLSIGGHASLPTLRWESIASETGTPDFTLSVVRQKKHIERDVLVKIDGDGHTRNYYRWFQSDQTSAAMSFTLPGLAALDSIDIELFALCDFNGTSLSFNGEVMIRTVSGTGSYHYTLPANQGVSGLNSLNISLRRGISGSYTDYIDINYPMNLAYTGTAFEFSSLGHSGLLRYSLNGYSAGLNLIDISNPENPATITGVSTSGNTVSFNRSTGSGISGFVAYRDTDLAFPSSLESWQGENLRADLSQYDCIVVSPRAFQAALTEYVSYRQANGGYRVKLAALEDIYDLFGCGLESPLAIRQYLKFAYESYSVPAPFAVVLVGDGHYDFKDNLGIHAASFVPPFIWDVEFSAGDDNYVYFGDIGKLDSDSSYVPEGDRGWDMMTGRWPVRSSSETASYIDKIKRYESAETQDIWRSRITFVADDEFKGDYSGEIIHTAQAETLSVFHTPPQMYQQKIYATEYSFASDGDKPSVNDAIVSAINDGTLIMNYIGHGSPDVWADEHIFRKTADLGRLKNVDKPVIIIAGSCSIGKFDLPGKEGMAEMFFRMEGGAISTISATRLVYSRDNAIFSYDLYDAIFGGASNLCEAVFAAKMLHQYENPGFTNLLRNDRSYVVFGDPLSKSSLPEYDVSFNIDSESRLTPLEYFGFDGEIKDANGNTVQFDGKVNVNVYDSRFKRHHPLGIDYSLGGPQIYRGVAEVTGGLFESGFIVPLDIDYGGVAAQISGFSQFSAGAAMGGIDSLPVADSAGMTSDNSGPVVEYAFEGMEDFKSGDRIASQSELIITLSDVSGINLTGGLGHRVELIIDNNNNNTVNLTDLFRYDESSYQSGHLRYTLPELSPELHTFKIKAWDNANNPSITEFEAMTTMAGNIMISSLMNYPNPMEEYTEFYFELSESAESAELKIFTLSGRNIKALKSTSLASGRNRSFYWDGRDLDGDRVAQGIYMYKITVKGRVISGAASADNMTEAFGKFVLLN
ncbi:MAG: type IX secretion system sortase PorU [candidate division Zixibacteria bacterium]|nr:type IX secretion system sortase PorU [candidate division Zixibacteria bacterium]